MTLLARVVALLAGEHVAHAVIGAAALAARGIARSTFDIDLLTTDPRVLSASLWEPLRTGHVTVDIRRGDPDDPLGGVVRLESSGERPVDVVLGRHDWQSRAVGRADRPPDAPPVVAARDLVLLKLYAGGIQDLSDVRALLQLPGADALVTQVEEDLVSQSDAMRERWTRARA